VSLAALRIALTPKNHSAILRLKLASSADKQPRDRYGKWTAVAQKAEAAASKHSPIRTPGGQLLGHVETKGAKFVSNYIGSKGTPVRKMHATYNDAATQIRDHAVGTTGRVRLVANGKTIGKIENKGQKFVSEIGSGPGAVRKEHGTFAAARKHIMEKKGVSSVTVEGVSAKKPGEGSNKNLPPPAPKILSGHVVSDAPKQSGPPLHSTSSDFYHAQGTKISHIGPLEGIHATIQTHPPGMNGKSATAPDGTVYVGKDTEGYLKNRTGDHAIARVLPLEQVTHSEIGAVRDYAGSAYGSINRHLRGKFRIGDLPESKSAELVRHIDSAIGRHRTEEKVYVHRGMSDSHRTEPYKVGDIIENKAYASVSTDSRVAESFARTYKNQGKQNVALVEYVVPRGTKAIPVGGTPLQGMPESEIVLHRNHAVRIKEIRSSSQPGIPLIIAEYVR
jgi:hypothetical protein